GVALSASFPSLPGSTARLISRAMASGANGATRRLKVELPRELSSAILASVGFLGGWLLSLQARTGLNSLADAISSRADAKEGENLRGHVWELAALRHQKEEAQRDHEGEDQQLEPRHAGAT